MNEKKSPIEICNEILNAHHTEAELQPAFDQSLYAVCFNYDRGHVRARHELFAAIREVSPEVIITHVDLHIATTPPALWRDQLLLIDKGGTEKTADIIKAFMAQSGIISYEYRIVSLNGAKVCHGSPNIKRQALAACLGCYLDFQSGRAVLHLS